MKKHLIIAGLILITSAILWYLFLGPYLNPRLYSGWQWNASFIGIQGFPDPVTGRFPEKIPISIYDRHISVINKNKRSDYVTVKDLYEILDIKNGKILWKYIFNADVDCKTGRHHKAEYKEDIYLFPRNSQKTVYRFRANYLKGVPLTFIKEEVIEDLNTYFYSYKGRGEYTESYAGTDEYPGVPVKAGQEIKCADDQFILKVWVEPVTGEILKLEESCYSGDYIFDIKSGNKVAPVLIWGGVTAGDDNLHRAEWIKKEKKRVLLVTQYIPALLMASGVLCVAIGLAGGGGTFTPPTMKGKRKSPQLFNGVMGGMRGVIFW